MAAATTRHCAIERPYKERERERDSADHQHIGLIIYQINVSPPQRELLI